MPKAETKNVKTTERGLTEHPHRLFEEGHFSAEVLVDCVNHGAPHAPDGPTDATFMNYARDFSTFGYGNG